MRTLNTLLISLSLILLSFSSKAQTTLQLDSLVFNDSTFLTTTCLGNYVNLRPYIQLSGYSMVNNDSLEFSVNWGDGITETSKFRIYQQGSQNWVYPNFYHIYQSPGTFYAQMTILAPDLKTDTKITNDSAVIVTCGNISGISYFDVNNNCVKDLGENLAYGVIEVYGQAQQITYYAYIDYLGNWSVNVPAWDLYDVNYQNFYIAQSCPANGFSSVPAPSSNLDFGVQCGTGFDLTGNVWGQGFRPGFARTFIARPHNKTCNNVSGKFKIVLSDPRISYNTGWFSPIAPHSVSGDTLIWNYTNLSYTTPWLNSLYKFSVVTDTSASIEDTICIQMIVEPIAGDIIPGDNIKTYCFPVRNSFDPNDKLGLPIGIGPNKIIDRGQKLDYTINFQNTGNDTAYKVVLIDSIPEELDLSTLVINGASHDFNYFIVDERALKFEFNDINLPDSNTNESASHGSVNFTLQQVPNLPYGTEIENTAYIYFDFNEAIVTNTEHHRVDIISGIQNSETQQILGVKIYPNPSNGILFLDVNSKEDVEVNLYNLLGNKISSEILNSGVHSKDISELNNGVYLLEALTSTDRKVEKLIIQK